MSPISDHVNYGKGGRSNTNSSGNVVPCGKSSTAGDQNKKVHA